jgi:hypothetical protein
MNTDRQRRLTADTHLLTILRALYMVVLFDFSAPERGIPIVARGDPGQDPGLADQWVRVLHRAAHP